MALTVVSGVSLAASAAVPAFTRSFGGQRLPEPARLFFERSVNETNVFSNRASLETERANKAMGIGSMANSMRRSAPSLDDLKPTSTYGPCDMYGSVDGPDGQDWHYTLHLTNNEIQYEWFTDYILQSFEVVFYDGEGREIARVKDKVRYAEDEVRMPMCDLLPVVTRHFVNTDDRLEVFIGLAVNTDIPGNMRFRSIAYAIDGEKDEEGYDKPLYQFDHLICDVLDASTEEGERYYMTTMDEQFGGVTWEDQDQPWFWEKYCASKYVLDTYGPAQGEEGPVKALTTEFPLQQLPGDQESGGYFLSKTVDGVPYAVVSKLEETLTEPFANIMEDMFQRENNKLLIDLYRLDAPEAPVQTTAIPFQKRDDRNVQFTFFGVGFMRYQGDILVTEPGKADYIITSCDYLFSSDGTGNYSYYKYDGQGQKVMTLFEGADATKAMDDIEGQESQQLFIGLNSQGYTFNMIDLESARVRAVFSNSIKMEDNDPEGLTANIARIAEGDSYVYVDELRLPSDEEGKSFMRFAWLDESGTPYKVEEVNMGYDVNYAQSFLSGAALNPDAYYEDEEGLHEYMILIKRGQPNGTATEELLIGQERSEANPDGKDLLLVKADERGGLSTILPYFNLEVPVLYVGYANRREYFADFYRLPLGSEGSGVETAVADGGELALEGKVLKAEGLIEVHTIAGAKVAEGRGSLDLSALGAGIYVGTSNGSTLKIAVK